MADLAPQINRDGKVTVKILNNGLEAAVTVYSSLGDGKPHSSEMIKKELRKAGVVFGIDESEIREIIEDEIFEKEVLVAKGILPVDGQDAKLNYFFEIQRVVKPKEDEKGNVDYKELNLLQNVKSGAKLVELIPPKPGKAGKTVTGNRILPEVGAMRKLPLGMNTEISPDNPNIMIASVDGNVSLKGGSLVQVDPIYVVTSHVDFKTGNIDYIGALVIYGDVKAGFSVKTQSNLEIQGLVEDANITAGSNVMIKKGFLGKGNGTIIAEGNVNLKFCENQSIISKGDIIIGVHAVNCSLKSDSKIQISKGVLVGGFISAKKGIEAKELGNNLETNTEIVVGIDEKLVKTIEEAEEEILKCDENIENVKKALYRLIKKKMENKGLPQEQANLMEKLQKLQGILPEQRNLADDKKEKAEEEMKKYENAEIKVLSKVFPGVKIQMQKYKKVINKEMGPTTFKIEGGEIQAIRG